MDADRFDLLARSLMAPSRRGFGRALAGLGLAGGLSALWNTTEIAAKRKKKKKKCKGATKKCGKKCIPKGNCCTILDCGHAAGCVNGRCECLEGFRPCGDTCILDDRFSCCGNAECGVIEGFAYDVCIDHDCKCSGFHCGSACCTKGEVCVEDSGVCQTGPCPDVQFCDGGASYNCGNGQGACTTTASGGPACVDWVNIVCMACNSDAACASALGAGAVCVNPGGCACEDPINSFCARTIPV